MSIESAEDLRRDGIEGKVTRAVLKAMKEAVRPGISTGELDEIGAALMRADRGRSHRSWSISFPAKTASASTMRLDGLTVRARDRSLAAHYEHTVVVTSGGALLLTA